MSAWPCWSPSCWCRFKPASSKMRTSDRPLPQGDLSKEAKEPAGCPRVVGLSMDGDFSSSRVRPLLDAELPALVKSGRVPIAVVDDAVRRVLRVKFALGIFGHPFTDGPEVAGAVADIAPLPAGRQKIFGAGADNPAPQNVLLPLNPSIKRIALIGPLADDASDMVGAWSGANNFGDVRTLHATMEERAQPRAAPSLPMRREPKFPALRTPGSPPRLPRHRIPMLPFSPSASRVT